MTSSTGCSCLNHRRNPKIQHKTYEAALSAALALVRKGKAAHVYDCPTSDRFHVAIDTKPRAKATS